MKTKFTILYIYLFLNNIIYSQTPFKINTITGGYLFDNAGNPVRNDKNWDINALKLNTEFLSNTATLSQWNYLPKNIRANPATSIDHPNYYIIQDGNDFVNSPECNPPYSNVNKTSHYFTNNSNLTTCILRLADSKIGGVPISGWYCDYTNVSCNINADYNKIRVDNWFDFTSGYIESKEAFKYGYFETRCRIKNPPANGKDYNGFGYNFWLYDNDNDNVYSEIDIFETDLSRGLMTSNIHLNLQQKQPFGVNTIHNRADPNKDFLDCDGIPFYLDKYIDMYSFHTFALEWLPNNITTYYDENRVMQYRFRDNPNYSPSYFKNMNIIMGFGAPYFCKNTKANPNWNSSLPIDYEIDYVKVYKLIDDSYTTINQSNNTNFDFNNYNYGVKNQITMGCSNCTAIVNNGMNVSLRAINDITLNEGFEVKLGAEFYAASMGQRGF